MLTLCHSPQSRSTRPRWLLEELGVPYEVKLVRLDAGEQKAPGYLKLNPNGTVPTLVDGDLVLWESAAICEYLADKYADKGFAPTVGTPERGKYYQWIHYAMSAIEPPLLTIFLHSIRLPEAERVPQLVDAARERLDAALAVVNDALAGREWMLGSQFTVADVMIGSTLSWAQRMGIIGDAHPNTQAYVARCMARPAMQRANE